MNPNEALIALDCDGVLLDYGTAYGAAWQRAFGQHPDLKNPHAYWPMDRWGVPRLSGNILERFRAVFDEEFWSTIPPISGAVEACQILVSGGYKLVCVTALDSRYADARSRNLIAMGFPVFDVVTTDHDAPIGSPKAAAIAQLRPVAFVDDFAPYLMGLDPRVHKALIVRDPIGSPNFGVMLNHSHSQHVDLLAFAKWWTRNGSR